MKKRKEKKILCSGSKLKKLLRKVRKAEFELRSSVEFQEFVKPVQIWQASEDTGIQHLSQTLEEFVWNHFSNCFLSIKKKLKTILSTLGERSEKKIVSKLPPQN